MEIGEKIRQQRRLTGMKQEELSKRVGVSLKTIQRWENGERSPRMDEINRLSTALDKPLGYFVGMSDINERLAVNPLPSSDDSKKESTDSSDNGRDILTDNKAGHLIFRHGNTIVDIPDTPENKNLYWRVVEKMLSASSAETA